MTLLKVAGAIVDRRARFHEHGDEAIQPLVQADIAAAGRHEFTVCRVHYPKNMEATCGVFELKRFLSSHVGTVNGGEVRIQPSVH